MIGKNWWKALGIILVFYSLVAGILVPMKPGIIDKSLSQVKTGEQVKLKVTGYNVDYMLMENGRAWLKLDSIHALPA